LLPFIVSGTLFTRIGLFGVAIFYQVSNACVSIAVLY
jgi:hypothetical protein